MGASASGLSRSRWWFDGEGFSHFQRLKGRRVSAAPARCVPFMPGAQAPGMNGAGYPAASPVTRETAIDARTGPWIRVPASAIKIAAAHALGAGGGEVPVDGIDPAVQRVGIGACDGLALGQAGQRAQAQAEGSALKPVCVAA